MPTRRQDGKVFNFRQVVESHKYTTENRPVFLRRQHIELMTGGLRIFGVLGHPNIASEHKAAASAAHNAAPVFGFLVEDTEKTPRFLATRFGTALQSGAQFRSSFARDLQAERTKGPILRVEGWQSG